MKDLNNLSITNVEEPLIQDTFPSTAISMADAQSEARHVFRTTQRHKISKGKNILVVQMIYGVT